MEATITNCLLTFSMSPCKKKQILAVKVRLNLQTVFYLEEQILTVGYGIHFILQNGYYYVDSAGMDA